MSTPKEKPLYISMVADLPYAYSAGRALSRFLIALRDEAKILGSHCPECNRTLVPPRAFCSGCQKRTDEFVEVGPGGVLDTFSVINFGFIDPFTGVERPVPYGYGIIKLDNSSNVLPHFLDVSDAKKLAVGQRVEAVFEPAENRTGTLMDIKHFRVIIDEK